MKLVIYVLVLLLFGMMPFGAHHRISLRHNDAMRLKGGHLLGAGGGMYVTKADFERAGVKYNEFSHMQNWGAVWRSRKYAHMSSVFLMQ